MDILRFLTSTSCTWSNKVVDCSTFRYSPSSTPGNSLALFKTASMITSEFSMTTKSPSNTCKDVCKLCSSRASKKATTIFLCTLTCSVLCSIILVFTAATVAAALAAISFSLPLIASFFFSVDDSLRLEEELRVNRGSSNTALSKRCNPSRTRISMLASRDEPSLIIYPWSRNSLMVNSSPNALYFRNVACSCKDDKLACFDVATTSNALTGFSTIPIVTPAYSPSLAFQYSVYPIDPGLNRISSAA
mmetsp:Transcript_22508/g.38860  ORF Transcript_22508/g.38860 Transcript_22508/m.38860 type:complete len:247 (+) Transcript_22508:497-1237(+)